jgi:hypothetical protein
MRSVITKDAVGGDVRTWYILAANIPANVFENRGVDGVTMDRRSSRNMVQVLTNMNTGAEVGDAIWDTVTSRWYSVVNNVDEGARRKIYSLFCNAMEPGTLNVDYSSSSGGSSGSGSSSSSSSSASECCNCPGQASFYCWPTLNLSITGQGPASGYNFNMTLNFVGCVQNPDIFIWSGRAFVSGMHVFATIECDGIDGCGLTDDILSMNISMDGLGVIGSSQINVPSVKGTYQAVQIYPTETCVNLFLVTIS